ncbi:alkaline phosphatase [Pseudoxanthomonas sangjuensis]|uniref:alkaline phosphatase n=1 Tax=Pseudoxanthomonas sangjuensis TaxID=1503750 RepID=UPI00139182EC|nr:alkaline phosphatase [Pseudoxanthomonas sangjuensis]KAF1713465.1 alkaline phosphatase [Pseudoxanthomonas sangjuensis]
MHRFAPALSCTAALTLLAGCATTAPTTGATDKSWHVDVPAVAHPGGETPQWWYRSAAARAAANGAMGGKAKNVILFLGDGMSLTTVAAARIFDGQRKGKPGEENLLSWEKFPATAFSKTYNTNSQVPDSAGTMSAITTGVKTHMGAIGVSAGDRKDCAQSLRHRLLNWLELADSAGLSAGIVTTTRVTHATPAASWAHSPNRGWENDTDLPAEAVQQGCRDIAQQFLDTRYGRGPQVLMGGGRRNFLPTTAADPEETGEIGARRDGRNLIEEWKAAHPGGAYVWNAQQFAAAKDAPTLLGLFNYDHLQYEHDRPKDKGGEPSLAQMTVAAIDVLKKNPNGYVLMVEGGRIDHASHSGNAYRALSDAVALSEAVQAAADATSADDTLIIVTADHSHTMSFVGYPVRGNPILGKVRGGSGESTGGGYALDGLGLPYTTINYANGPGYAGASDKQPAGPKRFEHSPRSFEPAAGRPDLRSVDTEDPDYMQETLFPTRAETHGGDDVGIWARGPGSEAIHGTVEENVIYHFIVQATPKLRERLCAAGTCDANGVPVELPKPADFEKK